MISKTAQHLGSRGAPTSTSAHKPCSLCHHTASATTGQGASGKARGSTDLSWLFALAIFQVATNLGQMLLMSVSQRRMPMSSLPTWGQATIQLQRTKLVMPRGVALSLQELNPNQRKPEYGSLTFSLFLLTTQNPSQRCDCCQH